MKYFDKTSFKGDSGYVSLKNAKGYLLELNKNDTIDDSFEKQNENDTIGKFYKKENSQNYILFLNDVANTKLAASHFILEIDQNGNILKSERYINGMYICCWKNNYDGFGKLHDYFYLKECSTGSGFCSGEIYVFKEIVAQGDLNSILVNLSYGMCQPYKSTFLSCRLTSRIEVKAHSLVLHYKYDKGSYTKSNKFKTKITESFDVEYISKDNNWIATDSTKLNQISY